MRKAETMVYREGVISIESRLVGWGWRGGQFSFYFVMLFYTALRGESVIVRGSCRITA